MNAHEAADWLDLCFAFHRVRGRFWQLVFHTDVRGRLLDAKEPDEEIRINPVRVRECWAQALREAGGGLAAAAANEMMKMGPGERVVRTAHSTRTLGFTAVGRERFGANFLDEIETSEELPGFWDFVRDAIVEPDHAAH